MKVIEKIWSELKIEKEIGRGAYGNVYKCLDTETDAYSAVKVISVPSAENGLVEYGTDKLSHEETQAYYKEIADDLVKEIEILKSLKGTDNIVEIYDAKIAEKEHGVGWYILIKMELLTEFKSYSAKNDFTEADVLKLGTDLCSALSVCHKAKILHRDIKPENIFVDSEGNYKLGDFGVAKQMEKTQGSMSIKGTFNYMSPEVFGGKKCDNRADLYSLAIVMYKLLNNNRMPFIDKDKETVRYSERQSAFEKRMRGDNIPPIPGVSSELNRVILKACAFNPVDRYRSAEEFASKLQQIANGQKIRKSVKKSLIKKIVATVAVVLVLSASGAFAWYNAAKLELDKGNPDYKSPEYVTVEKGEISAHSIDGKYLYYAEDGVYLIDEASEKSMLVPGTDKQPGNAYYDGEKVYYSYFEEVYGDKYKNTVYTYDVETKEETSIYIDGEYAMCCILYCEGEKIYFTFDKGEDESRLCVCSRDQQSYTMSVVTGFFDDYVKFFDKYIVYFGRDGILHQAEGAFNSISYSWNQKEELTFYKDGKFFFVAKTDKDSTGIFCYNFETDDKVTAPLADFNELCISSEAEILAVNDKHALVKDNEVLSLVIYTDGEKAKKKSVSEIHLKKYIDKDYKAFVDPEISNGIILSLVDEDEKVLYSIKENGKLAYIEQNDEIIENERTINDLKNRINKASKNTKENEVG